MGDNQLPVLSSEAPLALRPATMLPQGDLYPGPSLRQIFSIVWAYRYASLLIAFAVLATAVAVLKFMPRTYTATATLMVNYEINDPLNGKELPPGLLTSYMGTQMELMRSREVLLAVVDRLNLTHHKVYTAGYRPKVGSLREWAAYQLSRKLTVYQGAIGSQLFYVSFAARKPDEAARIANTVVEIYKSQDLARASGPSSERVKRYSAQLEELKDKVNTAQQNLTAFRQQAGLLDSGADNEAEAALLATLETRLLEAREAVRRAEAEASRDQSVGDQVLGSTLVQSLKTQLATQQTRMAELSNSMGPRHPEILALQAQIAETRRALAAELGNYAGNASGTLTAARKLEQSLEQAVAEQRARVLTSSRHSDEASKYRVELESAKTVYQRALEGFDQVLFASNANFTNVMLVSPATPPVRASSPKVMRDLVLATIGAVALGLGLPLLYALMRRRVRCRDDIERDFGLPVLAEFGHLRTT